MQSNFSDEEIEEFRQYVISEFERENLEPENFEQENIESKEEISDENKTEETPEIAAENAENQNENETSDEEISNQKQLTIPEIPKENFFIKLMRKSYDRKSKKAEQKIKSIEKMLISKQAERLQIENAIDSLNEKSRILSGEIIGLINANTFLETNFNGGLVAFKPL
jgi:hypothetical protein